MFLLCRSADNRAGSNEADCECGRGT